MQVFAMDLADRIVELHHDLMSGAYRHGSYHHFSVNDPKPRQIHKASVRDRLLHHALHRKLYPVFASGFIPDSFSCQQGKGLHVAIKRFQTVSRKVSRNHSRTCWVLKGDIRKFFASIDQVRLIEMLSYRVEDEDLMRLLAIVIKSFQTSPGKGIPLGNLTSQLFANIYLNEFDQFIRGLGIKYYLRYADDFVFLSHDRNELLSCIPLIGLFLSDRLTLSLHPDKLILSTYASGVDFLGWTHFPEYRIPRTKTRKRMQLRLQMSLKNETLQSYLDLLSHGDTYELQKSVKNQYWLWTM